MNLSHFMEKILPWLNMIREHCRWKATNLHGYIDDWALHPMLLKNSETFCFISPLTTMLLNCSFQSVLFLISLYYLSAAISASLMFPQYGKTASKSFRIRLYDSSREQNIRGTIYLLNDGCPFASHNFSLSSDHSSQQISGLDPTSLPVQIDGFHVKISNVVGEPIRGGADARAAILDLEGSDDNGASWRLTGRTAQHRYGPSSIRFLDQPLLTDELMHGVTFDYRPPWPVFAIGVLVLHAIAIFLAVPALLAASGRPAHAKWALIAAALALALLYAVAAAGFWFLARPLEAVGPSALVLLLFLAAALLAGPEPLLCAALPALALGGLLARLLHDAVALADPGNLLRRPPLMLLALAGLSLAIRSARRHFLRRAARAADDDGAAAAASWRAAAAADPALRAALARLAVRAAVWAERFPGGGGGAGLRQLNRFRVSRPRRRGAAFLGLPQVASLDQLYAQAAACVPFLARHAASWAARTRGSLHRPLAEFDPALVQTASPSGADGGAEITNPASVSGPLADAESRPRGQPGPVVQEAPRTSSTQALGLPVVGPASSSRWEEAMPPSWRVWVRAGLLKGPRRAAEKAAGCYGGDLSRLLDVCRARINFNHPDDLAACLDLVCEEAEAAAGCRLRSEGNAIRVLRVRSSLSSADGEGVVAESCGGLFAGIVVALQFDSDESRLFGVENHVCELQLLLHNIMPNLDDPEVLQRYHMRRFARSFESQSLTTHVTRYINPGRISFLLRWLRPWPRRDVRSAGWSITRTSSSTSEDPDIPMLSVLPEVESIEEKLDRTRSCGQTASTHLQNVESNLGLVEGDRLALRVFRRMALNPSKMLDLLASRPDFALETSSPGAKMFSSMPLEAAATNVAFRIVWLILSASLAYRGVFTLTTGQRNGVFVCSGPVRFRPLESRGVRSIGGRINSTIDNFGLLLDGCEVRTLWAKKSNETDGVVAVEYASPVRANGYFFTTSVTSEPSVDPIRWVVEVLTCSQEPTRFVSGSVDGSAQHSGQVNDSVRETQNEGRRMGTKVNSCEWRAVGASVWRIRAAGIDLFPRLAYSTPATPRGARIAADHRISWPKALDLSCATLDWSLALLGCAVAGWAGKTHMVPAFMGAAAGLDFILSVASTIGFQHVQDWRDTTQGCLSTFSRLIPFFGIVWFQQQAVWVLFFTVASSYAAYLIPTVFLYSVPALEALGAISELRPTGLLFAAIMIFRHRAFRRARRLLEADSSRYAAAWAFELARPGAHDWLHTLTCLAAHLLSRCPRRAIQKLAAAKTKGRQCLDRKEEIFCGGWRGRIETLGKLPHQARNMFWLCTNSWQDRDPSIVPVRSLDQLFVQALCCHPLLVRQVSTWALLSHGAFPADHCHENSASETLFRTLTGEEFDQSRDSQANVSSKALASGRAEGDVESNLIEGCSNELQLNDSACSESILPSSPTIRTSLASASTLLARKAAAAGIRFATIKSTSRAVEKAVRCYKKDVSLLLDLCRQSIVFRNGQDLVACLQAIVADSNIVVLKVKNRLDPAHPGGVASYRDVLVNLCIVTAEAEEIGVDGHVCEVQLLLQSFAVIKREDGHRRYVTFRNLRGE